MSIFTNLENDFETFWATHVKPFLTTEVEPALKTFLSQFDSEFGQQAVTAALGAVGALSGGTAFSAVVTGLVTTLLSDAKTDGGDIAEHDTTTILTTIQSALQVAKIANNVVTPADQTAAAAIGN